VPKEWLQWCLCQRQTRWFNNLESNRTNRTNRPLRPERRHSISQQESNIYQPSNICSRGMLIPGEHYWALPKTAEEVAVSRWETTLHGKPWAQRVFENVNELEFYRLRSGEFEKARGPTVRYQLFLDKSINL
jgi:hypothetical protein